MAQIGRPDSDVSVGSWSPYPASPTTLFDKINEVTPNGDTDYIVSATDEDECELGLTDVDDPGVGTGHIIRCYAYSPVGGGAREQMYIALVENGNVRAQSGAENVDKGTYGLIEYTLLESEANAITNYANLRIRLHITKTDPDEPIRVTQAEFECPDAAGGEFPYAGDIPMTILPDDPEAILSKGYAGSIPVTALPSYTSILDRIYAGAIPVSALPSYTSILDRVYAGAIPMVVLPDFPKAIAEKSYAGAVALGLIPDSTYDLLFEYVYGGDVGMGILPSYTSILDGVYAGDVPMVLTPSSTRILNRLYAGDIPLVALPNFPVAPLEKGYLGDIPLVALPDFSKAILEKSYAGGIGLVLTPESIYELVVGGGEFVYGGDIPLIALPSSTRILDRVYAGAVPMSVLPSYSSILDRVYAGDVNLIALPNAPVAPLSKSYGGDIGLVLTPEALYVLIAAENVFVYAGALQIALTPEIQSVLDRAYKGEVNIIMLPASLFSGIRAARDTYVLGKPYGEKKELKLIGEKELELIGEKTPVLINKG